jgi:transposase
MTNGRGHHVGRASAALEPGASVSAIAREAGVHPSQLWGWRRQLRATVPTSFTPVRVAEEPLPIAAHGSAGDNRDRAIGSAPADHRRGGPFDPDGGAGCAGERATVMIPILSGVRVWIATGHTDMRRGMNSLALRVQEGLKRDPHLCVGGDYVADAS